jgi:sulfoxide reductase heme-binding subunit YedZ
MTTWLLMRGTGLVALVLLTATVLLGVASTVPHAATRRAWPRWFTQAVHRDVSLLAVALVAAHVTTAVLDPHVHIGVRDVVLPFGVTYRPFWVGLGTLSVDLLLAVVLSSTVRLRLGGRAWRYVHWLAYAAWPVAVAHGVGTGTDARMPAVVAVTATCIGSVLLALTWRAAIGATPMRLASLFAALALTGAFAPVVLR